MDRLYDDIVAKVKDACPWVEFITMYNSQFEDLGGEEGAKIYSFPMPCVLVEFDDDIEWHQLGNGVQIADPLNITLHFGVNLLDAGDGTLELNKEVYQRATQLFAAMNKFEPDGCVQWIRIGHTQSKNHDNVYHFQQKYRTNYIDTNRSEPVGSRIVDPPITLNLNVSYDPPPYLKDNG